MTRRRDLPGVVARFLRVIEKRAGLLAARGEGVYAFSHLTFQEYLAALAAANRDDYVEYLLARSGDAWWREVILLAAGYLSSQSRARTTRLIRAIADHPTEPEPYHNLVLAADCLRDVGGSGNRVAGDLPAEIQRRLRADIELDFQTEIDRRRPQIKAKWQMWVERLMTTPATFNEQEVIKELVKRKSVATAALVKAGAGYWTPPYGEPEWVAIPAGEFWLGGEGKYDGKPAHRLHLPAYQIARTPITNAQYHLFTQAADHQTPGHWEDERPPKRLESHPVVNVTWRDAIAYCRWLSEQTGQQITLPSEAEWEKAARGDKDQRDWPWGDQWDATRCNNGELGLNDTTPVGIFPNGASPYGCLDMVGNIWEWTRSEIKEYPYNPKDGREDLLRTNVRRVLRGGAFNDDEKYVRCASRYSSNPAIDFGHVGFRVIVMGSPL